MASTPTPLPRPERGQTCPCGSGKSFELCCEPIIRREQPAPNAEALMRARFSAHVAGDLAFLHHSVLETHDKPFVAEGQAGPSPWTRLVIHSHETGRTPDIATVDFTAWFAEGEQEIPHQEKGEFKKLGSEWLYTRALRLGPPPVKAAPKVGRNDPCPCGSGKKFKHCCLKA
jgi:SEC-C motif-containing protein